MNFKREKKFCFVFVVFLLIFVTPTFAVSDESAWKPRSIVLDTVDVDSTIVITYLDGTSDTYILDSAAARKGLPADIDKHNTIIMKEKPQYIKIKVVVTNYGMNEINIKYNSAIYKEDKMLESHGFSEDVNSVRKYKWDTALYFHQNLKNYEAEAYFLLLIAFSVNFQDAQLETETDTVKEQMLINYLIETEEEKEGFWDWLFE